MFTLNSTPGRTCLVDGKEFLFFSGYSYLGMNHVKEFTKLIKEGIDKYGILFPSSRISNTRLALYEEFENTLSEMTGLEETVSFSSGFLAGKTISNILSDHENILVAPQTHPALDLKSTQKLNAIDFNNWSNDIAEIINTSNKKEFVLASDSVNILTAEINDFSFLKKIKKDKKIICLIDDSHGIGIPGTGTGTASSLIKKENIEYIICYSLSKAFNIEGGAVSCSKIFANKLRTHPNYTGSTAINPALIHAFLKSKKIYSLQKEKLFQNILLLKKNLPPHFIKKDFDLPIFICEKENAEEIFYKKKIIISSFAYPHPSSKKINRIIVSALHTTKDIKKLREIY
ncbi:MAG: aminotransferase class I/II-fold pyridoxal phosphate-dependent enzyme [Bacteroidota bacterium]|nr:aminotransferase class I/II-fold pyridoxal phosphate-dependent enzyme [Bacteroidota bacterium]